MNETNSDENEKRKDMNMANANENEVVMDEYGRTADERTIELTSRDANRIAVEQEDGGHDTYADALAYVIERGLKEIERQRDSAAKQEAQRKNAAALAKFNDLLTKNPKLAQNPAALIAALKAMGAYTGNVKSVLQVMGFKDTTEAHAVPASQLA